MYACVCKSEIGREERRGRRIRKRGMETEKVLCMCVCVCVCYMCMCMVVRASACIHTYMYGQVSTVTYLNGIGGPTLIFNQTTPDGT